MLDYSFRSSTLMLILSQLNRLRRRNRRRRRRRSPKRLTMSKSKPSTKTTKMLRPLLVRKTMKTKLMRTRKLMILKILPSQAAQQPLLNLPKEAQYPRKQAWQKSMPMMIETM